MDIKGDVGRRKGRVSLTAESGKRAKSPQYHWVRVAFAVGCLAGAVWGLLTLRINPQLLERGPDRLLLLAYLVLFGGLVWAVVGSAVAVVVRLLGRFLGAPARAALFGCLLVPPLLYTALLPDAELFGGLLTQLLFEQEWQHRALALALGLLVSVAAGVGVDGWLRDLPGRLRRWPWLVWVALMFVVVASTSVLPQPTPAPMPSDRATEGPETVIAGAEPIAEAADPAGTHPHPVILLCTDGADPRVVARLLERHELPTFELIKGVGAWGSLATLEPTLSPAVWTTLATGKLPQAHGIRHFVVARLPGLSEPVLHFPLHTGLNFRVLPLLERLPGFPVVQYPYTSDRRQVEALWNIVGRRYPVGVFRWLATWPAEEVNGFNVAARVAKMELVGDETSRALSWPPAALNAVEKPTGHKVTEQDLRPYLAPGVTIDWQDEDFRRIARSLSDSTSHYLPRMIESFRPQLTLASFYPVDGFQHRFNVDARRDGPFAPAIEERYREVDRRLARLLRDLDERQVTAFNLVLVSDHGYDFEQDHHAHAPPGLFYAMGPDIRPGEVTGLSVLDIAPLVLRLLDLPLGEDMPGAQRRAYERVLPDAYLASFPERRIATWETGRRASGKTVPTNEDEAIKEELRSLGYIE